MAFLRLVADFPDGEHEQVVLFENAASNSCFGVIPMRFVLSESIVADIKNDTITIILINHF